MRILVAFASRHGSTADIAERIADTLTSAGHDATVRPASQAGDPSGYDAVVLGSAVYLGHWLKEAKDYVRRQQEALATRPVWLFSSGPIGTARTDDQGRDLPDAAAPQELTGLGALICPQEHRVFFGALDPTRLTLPERALRALPAGRTLLPEGDFREWQAVDQWAKQVAWHLQNTASSSKTSTSDSGRSRT